MDKYLSRSVSDIGAFSRNQPDGRAAVGGGGVPGARLRWSGAMTAESDTSSEELVYAFPDREKRSWGMLIFGWLARLFPCLTWLRAYDFGAYFKSDLVAGITVGTMLVPQAMSYAKLAGLPPIYGLYSGFVPIIAYSIFGSSRQVAIGPVALISLLVSNGLAPIVGSDKMRSEVENAPDLYVRLAILLALMVGVIECIMGVARLGWLIRFISHSVISGFTSGSAIIIGLSQAKNFLGYEVSRSSELIPLIRSIVAGFDQFLWQPFVMGFLVLSLLLGMKHLGKSDKRFLFLRAGGPLTALVLSTAFVKVFRPASISVVGSIPKGLPPFSLNYTFDHVKDLLPTAFLIAGVAILESVGIAKALATKNGYELDSNRELFGLGVANIVGSAFSAYPATGSFSRSAVNNDTGAKTGIAAIVTALVVCLALLFLTPLFTDIPQCALAAIVVSAVIGLVDYEEAIFLWRVDKKDFLLWLAASVITLFCGVEYGVLLSVLLSLVFVIYQSANPHIVVLGRLPGTTVYRNKKQYADAYIYHGIVVIRIDAPIYFANVSHINERLRELEVFSAQNANRGVEDKKIRYIILEMSPVTHVDSTAIHAIKDLYLNYKARHIQLALSNPNAKVMKSLAKAGIPDLIGREWFFVRVHDAVQVCNARLEERLKRLQAHGAAAEALAVKEEETRQSETLTVLSSSRFWQGTQPETEPLLNAADKV